jgi:hypothetical protein
VHALVYRGDEIWRECHALRFVHQQQQVKKLINMIIVEGFPSFPMAILGMWHNSLGLYRAVSHPGVTNRHVRTPSTYIYYAARWKSKMMVIAVWAAQPCVQLYYLLGKTAGQANSSDEKNFKMNNFFDGGGEFF